ncbi:MAG: ROK family protein [Chloroflexota bacterium]
MTQAAGHRRTTDVAIGVDIGGTNIRAARIDRAGTITAHRKVRTEATRAPALVRELVAALLDDAVVAIGIGIPGRVDRDGTTVLSAGYVDLAGVRLADEVAAATGRPAVMDNDAHMALTAELTAGAARDASDVALFTVGTGIGGAVAVDRRVIRGRGNAGQLGHLTLDPDGPVCNCGRHGCSEVYASGTALARGIREAGLPDGTTAQALLARADHDAVAGHVLRRWAGAWRSAIDTAVATLDPDLVVLGGGLGAAAAEAVARFAPPASPWFDCPVVAARLGDDAGVIGAGLRAFEAIADPATAADPVTAPASALPAAGHSA